MTIFPNIANLISFKEDRTILIRLLNLWSYWVKTVFIDSLYSTGYFFIISFTSYVYGKSPKIVWISF
jgi:hypothetical protein